MLTAAWMHLGTDKLRCEEHAQSKAQLLHRDAQLLSPTHSESVELVTLGGA